MSPAPTSPRAGSSVGRRGSGTPTGRAVAGSSCGPGPRSRRCRAGRADRHHRDPLHGEQVPAHRADRPAGSGKEDHRDPGPAGRVGPGRPQGRHRAEAGRHSPGGSEPSVQTHPDADHLRDHPPGSGGWCAEGHGAEGDAPPLHRPPARGGGADGANSSFGRRRTGSTSWRA